MWIERRHNSEGAQYDHIRYLFDRDSGSRTAGDGGLYNLIRYTGNGSKMSSIQNAGARLLPRRLSQ